MDSLPTRLAGAPITTVTGRWQRHAAARYANEALNGRSADGRWGTHDAFPVLYLGRPQASVVFEAYRHLVDPVDDPALVGQIRPRVLITAEVNVTDILDLRTSRGRISANVTLAQLQSDARDNAAYEACQNVSAAAHQLGLHGLITPAATRLGDTLVLFTDLLPDDQRPMTTETHSWLQLPPDPRSAGTSHLRLVRGTD